MRTDAGMLMHADEYWCIRYVDDVFLEPHLQIIYIEFIQIVYRLYTDCVQVAYRLCTYCVLYTASIQILYRFYADCIQIVCRLYTALCMEYSETELTGRLREPPGSVREAPGSSGMPPGCLREAPVFIQNVYRL